MVKLTQGKNWSEALNSSAEAGQSRPHGQATFLMGRAVQGTSAVALLREEESLCAGE